MNMILQRLYLVHHLLVDSKTTGGIDDYYIIALCFSLMNGMVGYFINVLVVGLTINRNSNLLAYDLQLVDSCRTIDIARNEQWLLVLLILEHVGELAGERCLTGTLQTAHQNNGRMLLQFQSYSLTAHKLSEFVMNKLHHKLSRLHRREDVHSESLFLDIIRKCLGNFIVDIGVEQSTAHVLHCLGNIYFCDLAFTLQYLERAFQAVA